MRGTIEGKSTIDDSSLGNPTQHSCTSKLQANIMKVELHRIFFSIWWGVRLRYCCQIILLCWWRLISAVNNWFQPLEFATVANFVGIFERPRVMLFQGHETYSMKRLIVRSRKVSNELDQCLKCSNRPEVSNAFHSASTPVSRFEIFQVYSYMTYCLISKRAPGALGTNIDLRNNQWHWGMDKESHPC